MLRDRRTRAGALAIAAAIGLFAWGGLSGGGTVAAGQRTGAGETFTIYSSLPLHGDSRPQSADVARAMRLALRDNGGRAGRQRITYISLNDATVKFGFWDPDRVKLNARKAASNPHAIAYLGEFNSGASALSIPILNRAGLLQVSPSNTHVGLTRAEGAERGEPARYYPTGRRTYGRVVPAEHTQAAALVSYMQDEGCTNAYVMSDTEVYGRGMAARVARIAAERGLAILANEAVDTSPANVRAAAQRVTAANAACFFFGGFTQNNAVGVFKAVAAGSPSIKLFGPDGIAEAAFTEELGPALEQRVFITNPTLDRRAYPPRGQRFFADFKAKYGRYPEPYAIYGYEARASCSARSGMPAWHGPTRRGAGRSSTPSSPRRGAGRCSARTTSTPTATRRCLTSADSGRRAAGSCSTRRSRRRPNVGLSATSQASCRQCPHERPGHRRAAHRVLVVEDEPNIVDVREQIREPVDLRELAADAVDDARAVAPDRDISLVGPDAAVVDGDPGQLRQVLANLMRNALVHTPPGTPIEVSVGTRNGDATLAVRDHGPGLPTDDPSELFDRFWRGDGSARGRGRGRGRAGAGLGLAIVAGVVSAHGGRAAAADADDGGARFEIVLPLRDGAG